jgi:transaldolase
VKFFLDTANLDELRTGVSRGMVDGVATNHKNVVVKCPLTRAGVKATRALSGDGIRANVTLCFSAAQAIVAAKAGAFIRGITPICRNYGCATQVLAASLFHEQAAAR